MNKKLIIFGVGEIAELAYYYFVNDSSFEVVAFTLDREYIESDQFLDLPLIPFEDVDSYYSPQAFSLFVALGYSQVNALRANKYIEAKRRGYSLASYISSRATILNDESFGENCFVLENNTVQPFCKVGNNVTLWSGNHIGHHSFIGDHSFISSHVVVSGGVDIGERCFIGVNATLRDHISIGDGCVIGAGAIILKDAKPNGVYSASKSQRLIIPSKSLNRI